MAETPEHLQSDEDVEEILRLAIRRSGSSPDGLRDRLHMSAAELGISETELQAAEEEYRKQKHEVVTSERTRLLEAEEWREWRAIKRHDLLQHLGTYLIVNGFLVFLNIRGTGNISWAMWPILAWGIAMGIHAVSFMAARSQEELTEFHKWQKKRRKSKTRAT